MAKKVVRKGAWLGATFGRFRAATYAEGLRRVYGFRRSRRLTAGYLPDKWQPMPTSKAWERDRRKHGLPVNPLPAGTLPRRRGQRRDYRSPERPDRFAARLCHYCGAQPEWLVEPVRRTPRYSCDLGAHRIERLDGCNWERLQ